MSIGTIDEKWRLTIPKEARRSMKLSPKTPVDVKLRRNSLVIRPLRRPTRATDDSLLWLLSHPAKADPRKLKKLDLEKMEDEMW